MFGYEEGKKGEIVHSLRDCFLLDVMSLAAGFPGAKVHSEGHQPCCFPAEIPVTFDHRGSKLN